MLRRREGCELKQYYVMMIIYMSFLVSVVFSLLCLCLLLLMDFKDICLLVQIPFCSKKLDKANSDFSCGSSLAAELSLKVLAPSQKSVSHVAPKCNLGSEETRGLKGCRVVKYNPSCHFCSSWRALVTMS